MPIDQQTQNLWGGVTNQVDPRRRKQIEWANLIAQGKMPTGLLATTPVMGNIIGTGTALLADPSFRDGGRTLFEQSFITPYLTGQRTGDAATALNVAKYFSELLRQTGDYDVLTDDFWNWLIPGGPGGNRQQAASSFFADVLGSEYGANEAIANQYKRFVESQLGNVAQPSRVSMRTAQAVINPYLSAVAEWGSPELVQEFLGMSMPQVQLGAAPTAAARDYAQRLNELKQEMLGYVAGPDGYLVESNRPHASGMEDITQTWMREALAPALADMLRYGRAGTPQDPKLQGTAGNHTTGGGLPYQTPVTPGQIPGVMPGPVAPPFPATPNPAAVRPGSGDVRPLDPQAKAGLEPILRQAALQASSLEDFEQYLKELEPQMAARGGKDVIDRLRKWARAWVEKNRTWPPDPNWMSGY